MRKFGALWAFAVAGAVAYTERPRFGMVTCEGCQQPTPKLDEHGSYACLCGDAVYVDPDAPAAAATAPTSP